MSRLLLIAVLALMVTLVPPLVGRDRAAAAAASSAGAVRSPGPEPQRVPRGRSDPFDSIDRGSRGMLDDEDAAAQQVGDDEIDTTKLEILPPACELELALAAAPDHLRPGAGAWALGEGGYGRVRESRNGFDCIVNRDHPRSLKPTCFDAEGAATIVPKIIEMGQWLIEGLAPEEIRQREEYGFVNGTFQRPSRAGVAYMLSNYNRPWFAQSGTLGRFPPHVMFYAPDLTNEDIGFDPEAFAADRRLPMVAYQGPHGYIIMITGENRPRAKDELKGCPSWVWE